MAGNAVYFFSVDKQPDLLDFRNVHRQCIYNRINRQYFRGASAGMIFLQISG